MGYTTDFVGEFTVLDAKTQEWVKLKDGVRKLINGFLNLETPGDSSAVIKDLEEEPVKNETN